MSKRFVSWVAVSSRPQIDGGSPTDQRERNQAHAAKWEGVIVADLEVPGESRSYIEYEEAKRNLEAYRQLDALIKQKSFDVLVCYNVGRLGRKRSLITTILDLCYEADILVYRTSNPPQALELTKRGYSDMLLEAIESTTFQNEIDQFVEHHHTGMKRRASRGLFPGNVPYGWKKYYNPDGKYTIVIDEDAAKAVKRAFELFMNGIGKEGIAIILNREGYKTYGRTMKSQAERIKRPLTNGTVRSFFERVWVYAGYAEVNRNSRKREFVREKSPNIPPIIDEAFLQRLLGEMRLRKKANPPKGNHLYSGIVACIRCNYKMSVVQRGSERRFANGELWSQPKVRCAQGCQKQVSFNLIDRAILDWLESLNHVTIDELIVDSEETSVQPDIDRLQVQLNALPAARERAYTAFVDGNVDKDTYQAQIKRVDAQKRALQDQIQALEIQAVKHRNKAETEKRYRTVTEAGKEMLLLGRERPAEVNQWLREYIRVEFDNANRTLSVHLR